MAFNRGVAWQETQEREILKVMAREIRPWYRPHIAWSSLLGIFLCGAGLYLSWLMLRRGVFVIGFATGLLCVFIMWECMNSVWRNRHPFIFPVRGNRKVKFTSNGRDEIIFEEQGRKIIIYTELWSKPNRGIYVSSIRKWEPPYENEPLTDDERQDILDLLCEDFDYRAVTYEIVRR